MIRKFFSMVALASSSLFAATFSDNFLLWENGRVPYTIDSGLNQQQIDTVNSAIDIWNNAETAVKLFPRKGNHENDYVTFRIDSNTCNSFIGRQGGQQYISCDINNGFSSASLIHEIGHAVGMYHEHQRSDRNDSVTVTWQSGMSQGGIHNLELRNDTNNVTEYDFTSVMHYPSTGYFGNHSFTITPNHFSNPINPSNQLSPLDIKGINIIYDHQALYHKGKNFYGVAEIDFDGNPELLSIHGPSGESVLGEVETNPVEVRRVIGQNQVIDKTAINTFHHYLFGKFFIDRPASLFMVLNSSGFNRFAVNNYQGQFGSTETNRIPQTAINGYDLFNSGDFNGDGVEDIFAMDFNSGNNRLFLNSGMAYFSTHTNLIVPGHINGFSTKFVADFDGDNREDFFCVVPNNGFNRWFFFKENISFSVETNRINTSSINDYNKFVVGNFNNSSSTTDIFALRTTDGANRLFINNGNATFNENSSAVNPQDLNPESSSEVEHLIAIDLNQDGLDDIVAVHSNGDVINLLNNGNNGFTESN